MRSTPAVRNSRIALAITLAITLGACATKHDTHPSPAPRSTSSTAPKPAHVAKTRSAPVAKSTVAPATATVAPAAPHLNMLAAATGIAECDDYLGNYKACHVVLGTKFTDIDTQLAELRTNILNTVRDQGTEPARAKCLVLVKERDEELKGRSCN